MGTAAWRLIGIALALALLLAADHYRPLLDTANRDLAKAGRDNLGSLAGEQGRKLGKLASAYDRSQNSWAGILP